MNLAIAPILTIASSILGAVGTIASGASAAANAEYQAKQLEINAKEERAAGQHDAMEYDRQKRLALSRIQAVSSASGLGATDPTVLDTAGDVAAYGTLQSQIAQYGGDSRAAGLTAQAAGARAQGKAAQFGSFLDAGSTILGGFTSMYDKYGKGRYSTGLSPYGAASGWYG
jgi:hypothetical protein